MATPSSWKPSFVSPTWFRDGSSFWSLLSLMGTAVITGLTTLYVAGPGLFRTPGRWPAMADLGRPGSLGNWFSSLLLLMAAFYAVVNYTVRRHKVDDYRGRYRIWLWAAASWFLMASDTAASLHQCVQGTLVSLTGTRLVGDGTILWLGPSMILFGFIGTRLLIDMWTCRAASASFIFSALAYLAALVSFFQVVRLLTEVADTALSNGLLLAGHFLLACSMVLHARFVLLDAEGRLPRPAVKRQAKSKGSAKAKVKPETADAKASTKRELADADQSDELDSDDEDSEDRWIAVDPAHSSGTSSGSPVLRRAGSPVGARETALPQKVVAPSSVSPLAASDEDSGKLSKADRKALKKKLLQERAKAEQRKAANW